MRRFFRSAVAMCALAVLTSLPAGAQEAPPTTTFESLAAQVTTTAVAVEGKALFTAGATQFAEDTSNDHVGSQTPLPSGTDLLAATFQPLSPSQVEFTMSVGNMPPTGGTNEVINYTIPFVAQKGSSRTELQLQAHRSAAGRDIICSTGLFVCTGSPDNIGKPVFDIQTCTVEENPAGGEQRSCASTPVGGEFTDDGTIIWRVHATALGGNGQTLTAGEPLAASRSASGVTWWTDGSAGDIMLWSLPETAFPAPTVELGIAPAGTPVDQVVAETTVTAKNTGTFTANLTRPVDPGEYVVVARACFGPDSCAVSSTPISVL